MRKKSPHESHGGRRTRGRVFAWSARRQGGRDDERNAQPDRRAEFRRQPRGKSRAGVRPPGLPAGLGGPSRMVGSTPRVVGSSPRRLVGRSPRRVVASPRLVGTAPVCVGTSPLLVGSAPSRVGAASALCLCRLWLWRTRIRLGLVQSRFVSRRLVGPRLGRLGRTRSRLGLVELVRPGLGRRLGSRIRLAPSVVGMGRLVSWRGRQLDPRHA